MVAPAMGERLVLRRTLAAPPETVFDVWTQPDHMKRWLAPSDEFTNPFVEVELRVGGTYRIAFQSEDGHLSVVGGKYVALERPNKIAFTWRWEPPHEFETHETLVTVEIAPCDEGAELTLTHERFPLAEMLEKHNAGWSGALDRLVRAVANT